MFFVKLLILVAIIYSTNAEYCVSAYCTQLNRVFAKKCYSDIPVPTLSKTCTSDAQIQKLSAEEQAIFVGYHNKYRNNIASGISLKFNTASKMQEVSWDHELAFLAAINVAQCQMKHDDCRASESSDQPGQNLYMAMKSGGFYENKEAILASVYVWFKEYVFASMADLNRCCGPDNNFYRIGHFTQMMKEDVDRIGCAVVKFTDTNGWKTSGIACAYSKMQMIGEPIYHSGPPASECSKGKSTTYAGLCK